jgi:hypothetical protein
VRQSRQLTETSDFCYPRRTRRPWAARLGMYTSAARSRTMTAVSRCRGLISLAHTQLRCATLSELCAISYHYLVAPIRTRHTHVNFPRLSSRDLCSRHCCFNRAGCRLHPVFTAPHLMLARFMILTSGPVDHSIRAICAVSHTHAHTPTEVHGMLVCIGPPCLWKGSW